mmetsp:Transcript_48822/g.136191  ORF Transcript_48822/g.136191 Transcript_48822/m.136191 type:complete len:408 (+) Transcript_48822:870-2093(+)
MEAAHVVGWRVRHGRRAPRLLPQHVLVRLCELGARLRAAPAPLPQRPESLGPVHEREPRPGGPDVLGRGLEKVDGVRQELLVRAGVGHGEAEGIEDELHVRPWLVRVAAVEELRAQGDRRAWTLLARRGAAAGAAGRREARAAELAGAAAAQKASRRVGDGQRGLAGGGLVGVRDGGGVEPAAWPKGRDPEGRAAPGEGGAAGLLGGRHLLHGVGDGDHRGDVGHDHRPLLGVVEEVPVRHRQGCLFELLLDRGQVRPDHLRRQLALALGQHHEPLDGLRGLGGVLIEPGADPDQLLVVGVLVLGLVAVPGPLGLAVHQEDEGARATAHLSEDRGRLGEPVGAGDHVPRAEPRRHGCAVEGRALLRLAPPVGREAGLQPVHCDHLPLGAAPLQGAQVEADAPPDVPW